MHSDNTMHPGEVFVCNKDIFGISWGSELKYTRWHIAVLPPGARAYMLLHLELSDHCCWVGEMVMPVAYPVAAGKPTGNIVSVLN